MKKRNIHTRNIFAKHTKKQKKLSFSFSKTPSELSEKIAAEISSRCSSIADGRCND